MEEFGKLIVAAVLGGGGVGLLLKLAARGWLGGIYVEKALLPNLVPCTERLQRIEQLEGLMQKVVPQIENYGARLQSLEDRLLEPVARMADRFEKMAEKDHDRDVLFAQTAKTIEMVAQNQERMEKRLEGLAEQVADIQKDLP